MSEKPSANNESQKPAIDRTAEDPENKETLDKTKDEVAEELASLPKPDRMPYIRNMDRQIKEQTKNKNGELVMTPQKKESIIKLADQKTKEGMKKFGRCNNSGV